MLSSSISRFAGKIKNLYLLVFILCLIADIFPQNGWVHQSPIPTVETLSDVYFTDTFNGTAVGGNKIIRTTDGGTNWIIQYHGIETYYNFQAIYFTDANNGWVVDYLGKILKTTDGGYNWVKINYESKYLRDVHFIDSNTGFVVGYGILKTTDGGITWSNKLTDLVSYNLRGVTFSDESNGTAVGSLLWGSEIVLRTTDGGEKWFTQLSIASQSCVSVCFIDSNTGFVVGQGGILKTTNGGNEWITQLKDSTILLNSVCFTDANTGTVVGRDWNNEEEEGIIFRTTDGGNEWIKNSLGIAGGNTPFSVSFSDANNGTVVGGWGFPTVGGDGPIILRTTDGGKNWFSQVKGTSYTLNGVSFTDVNTGTAVGSHGTIIRTSDGGNSWIHQASGTTNNLYDVCFTDANNGTVVGNNNIDDGGVILRTTDGGTNWVKQYDGIEESHNFHSVCFTDANNGTVVGSILDDNWEGLILRTTDGGKNWVKQTCGISGFIEAVCFTDVNIGWIAGFAGWDWFNMDGKILKTTDGGNEWIIKYNGVEQFHSIYFIDVNNGWAVGSKMDSAIILRTTDGGETWFNQFVGIDDLFSVVFHKVCFTDEYNGTVVGGGVILRTTDGGNNWTNQFLETRVLRGVSFTDKNTGTAVGDGGTILRTTTGGISSFAENKVNEIPKDFLLHQNYPNPFNPTTIIKYSISTQNPLPVGARGGLITLKIYDILGNEVATLVNEEKSAGSYEIEWNAEGLSSGVYFYQLKTGNFTATKKLLLLK